VLLSDFIRQHQPPYQPVQTAFEDRPMDDKDNFVTQAALMFAGRYSVDIFNTSMFTRRMEAAMAEAGTIDGLDLPSLRSVLHPLHDSPFTQRRYAVKRMCACGRLFASIVVCDVCGETAVRRVWIASIRNWLEVSRRKSHCNATQP
jgi:hypothetical protein